MHTDAFCVCFSALQLWKDHLRQEVEKLLRQGVILEQLPQERVIVALTLTLVKGVCEQAPRLLRNIFYTALHYISSVMTMWLLSCRLRGNALRHVKWISAPLGLPTVKGAASICGSKTLAAALLNFLRWIVMKYLSLPLHFANGVYLKLTFVISKFIFIISMFCLCSVSLKEDVLKAT